MRVAMLALLCVMPFGLTIGGMNSPTPAGLCCTSISIEVPDWWCVQNGCADEYPEDCEWTPCSVAPSMTPTAAPSMTPTTSAPSMTPTAAPSMTPTKAPSFARLTDDTIHSAVSQWCAEGNNRTEIEYTYGPIANWDTSQVTDMSELFAGESKCKPLGIGKWDTAAVTVMINMFLGASEFDEDIGNWNTTQVTRMDGMFAFASKFNKNIGRWKTGKVTSMADMFNGASEFNMPIGDWNTAAVTSMSNMFNGASKFDQFINAWNTAQVTRMDGMFINAATFNKPIGNWDTSKVTNMHGMFAFASKFQQNIGKWNTAKVTSMLDMFLNASSFNQALCWTVSAEQRADISVFVHTACPLVSLYDNPAIPPRNCWGEGTVPTNEYCTPIVATQRPTPAPTCTPLGNLCDPEAPNTCCSAAPCEKIKIGGTDDYEYRCKNWRK
jgi:surface protein